MPPLNNLQRSCLSLAVGHALIASPALQAATITVNSIGDGPVGDISGCTLREAIVSTNTQTLQGGCTMTGAGALDTINFALPASSTIVLSEGELEISRIVSITGPGETQLSIDAQDDSRIFFVNGDFAGTDGTSISGLTLTNGRSDSQGGAVYVNATASFTLSNSTISDSYSELGGGGIYVENSPSASILNSTISGNSSDGYGGGIGVDISRGSRIDNVTVSNNSSYSGGGIYIDESDSSTLSNSTISGNSSGFSGGGVYFDESDYGEISDLIISDNVAEYYGGGLYVFGDSTSLSSSTITNNRTANDGGGLSWYGVDSTIDNIAVTGNSASDFGGGIYLNSVNNLSIVGSTISNNSASTDGGGIFIRDSDSVTMVNSTLSTNVAGSGGGGLLSDDDSSVALLGVTINDNTAVSQSGGGIFAGSVSSVILGVNNVVANSVGGDCNITVLNAAYNWIGDNSCLATPVVALSGDPMLGPLQDNGGPTLTHAPLPGSGLIDASTNCGNATIGGVDQRGEPRGTSTCFIGSVEGVQEAEAEVNFFVIPLDNGRSVVIPL